MDRGVPHPSLQEARAVCRAKPVWGDLAKVYPFGEPLGVFPDGLDLQCVVPGMLQQWHRTTTGYWAGWVRYKIGGEYGGQPGAHWVGAYALDPRREGTTR
ncbi:hypothetical protein [Amycolatopsis balhimycina]|uniref:hypothetical protein n=1 Tax=Amycolatopsis balhimycina TaxID=208443 RepID=UPI0003A8FFD3|nr:hypothetical protein [Amycolatopsis balhimycina]